MKQTTIKEYIRNPETLQPRGIALAVRKNDEVFYGYSLLNVKKDRFDKDLGMQIAMNRAMSESYELPDAQHREAMVLNAFNKLEARAIKYFKDVPIEKVKLMPANVESGFTEE